MSTARIFLMSRRRELRTTWFPSTERPTPVKLLRAPMANRVGSERQPPSRAPIRLVGSVLLLGTLLAWWGTRDHRRLFGDLPRRPVAAAVLSIPPNIQVDGAAVARGASIQTLQCAGCHEIATRSSAPSYREIV